MKTISILILILLTGLITNAASGESYKVAIFGEKDTSVVNMETTGKILFAQGIVKKSSAVSTILIAKVDTTKDILILVPTQRSAISFLIGPTCVPVLPVSSEKRNEEPAVNEMQNTHCTEIETVKHLYVDSIFC